jgi:hypothetical protein
MASFPAAALLSSEVLLCLIPFLLFYLPATLSGSGAAELKCGCKQRLLLPLRQPLPAGNPGQLL